MPPRPRTIVGAPDAPYTLKIVGAPGSPYSRKLRAVLRYRRIPYLWVQQNSRDAQGIPSVPVQLIPVLIFPGEGGEPDAAAIDTTPLIRRLESEYPERSVIPDDPAMAFVDALLEDYADEWLTKAMFHYRWAFAPDIDKAKRVLPLWGRWDVPDERIAPLSEMFSSRQIERLRVVGSNETTGSVIEASYRRYLECLDAHLTCQPFLLGTRPASSDFGAFGQLTQLALFDPTSAAVTLATAPRIVAWIEVVEDMSGTEPDAAGWTPRDAVTDTLREILTEVGRVYAPFLLANAEALENGADEVTCEIDGKPWVQKPFPYQGKCLKSLRAEYAGLSTGDRDGVDAVLAGTGCEALFRS